MKFYRKHAVILSFAVLQLFFSAPGQTFFISIFVPSIHSSFHISQTSFMLLYGVATLLAALLLNPAGQLIDHHNPKRVLAAITILMAIGCWILGSATNVVMLCIGFLLVRFIGQGVFGLTASTLLARKFLKNRGRAMSLMTLGFSLSEAVFPFFSLLLLDHWGWRTSFFSFGILIIVVMLPIQWLLLSKIKLEDTEYFEDEFTIQPLHLPGETVPETHSQHSYTLKHVISDPTFYWVTIASCLPPMIVSGLFFYQGTIFELHRWPLIWIVTGLQCYALFKSVAALGIGPVIDKVGPIYPFCAMIFFLSVGAALITVGGGIEITLLYYIFIGIALGLSGPVIDVVWPNLYGIKHIGSIKGFAATFRNGLTAFGALPLALALDHGIPVLTVIGWTSVFIFLLTWIPLWVAKKTPRIKGALP